MKKNKKSLANKFIVEGLNLARFLNVLLEKDIKLYNIKRPEYNIIEFECSIKDSYVVQQYANKINLKVQKQNKGILKFFSFLKNRLGILVGGIVAIVLFFISNQFTMNFYVLGLENIEKSRVEAVLNNHGIEKYKINNLIKKGYLRKVQSEVDKREFHLEVTEKYLDYYNITYSYIGKVMNRLEERLTPEELQTLEKVLNVMSDELMPEIELGNSR